MRLIKKWLFPVLTCLIVVGAAVLPARVSQARDAGLFGQVHAEALDADALPVAEPPTLLDRLALYSNRLSMSHPILSSEDFTYFESAEEAALAQSAQELLTGGGVLLSWVFEEDLEDASATRILLWDPATADTFQEPFVFWGLSWRYEYDKSHSKSIEVTADAETGLPISLWVNDTNMSQWLPYDRDCLRALAERFFGILGLDVQEVEPDGPMYVPSLNLKYAVAGTGMSFLVSRSPTSLNIKPDVNWQNETDSSSGSVGYDG